MRMNHNMPSPAVAIVLPWDVLDAYKVVRNHLFDCTIDNDEEISVMIPWSGPNGTTGVEEVGGINSWARLREVLGY